MSQTRDIVTGVDRSEHAPAVLARALAEGETAHRTVRLVQAWANPVWVGDTSGLGIVSVPPLYDGTAGARDVTDALLAVALPGHPDVSVRAETPQGDAGDVLVRAAQEAGLVVVGGRSHGALASLLLGSTTGYVLHHAACPVMVVPDTATAAPFRRVVVGFDDSACSRSALRWALDAAHRYGCPLVVVHALRLTNLPAQMSAGLLYPDLEDGLRVWLDSEVARAKVGVDDVALTTEVHEGSATQVLLGRTGPEDLLVLGSRGHGGFTGLLLGSVAMQCAQHGRGTVVVVRAGAERLEGSGSSAMAGAGVR